MANSDTGSHHAITDLNAGQRLDDEIYLIIQKDLRTTSNGSLYIHAVLADRTGQLVARMWNASREIYDSIPESGLMHVTGRVESYKGKPQFIIDGLRTVDPGAADPSDFLPSSAGDVEQMWQRVVEILRAVKSPDLLALLAKFIRDEKFVTAFKLLLAVLGVASTDDALTFVDLVENGAVVVAFFGVVEEVLDGQRGALGVEPHGDVAVGRLDQHDRVLRVDRRRMGGGR